MMAAGARSTLFVYSVRADYLLSTFCATKTFFWKIDPIRNRTIRHRWSKRGRTQSFLTGFEFWGESTEGLLGGLLAQRQAAHWGTGGGGTANVFVYSVRADVIASTRCATSFG